jgi:hypothetical protein
MGCLERPKSDCDAMGVSIGAFVYDAATAKFSNFVVTCRPLRGAICETEYLGESRRRD